MCTSWADETDEERGVDSIVEFEGTSVGGEDDWEITGNEDDNGDDDDDGNRTTRKRLAGRLEEDPSRRDRLAGRLEEHPSQVSASRSSFGAVTSPRVANRRITAGKLD